MALREIIDIASAELGLDLESNRTLLLRLINRAAREIYNMEDLPGSLRECVLSVPTNKTITLPDYIGQLRAMRTYNYGEKVELNDMMPRYSYQPWPSYWQRWRLKNDSAIISDIANAGPLFFQSQIEDPVAVVSICGRAADAFRVNEDVTMESNTEQSEFSYTNIFSLQRHTRGKYDINVLGPTGTQIATIRNSKLSTSYRVCDLSEFPFVTVIYNDYYIEVLYKEDLEPFYYDSDVFPCGDAFDDAIAIKACEIHYRPQDGKKEKAKDYAEQSQSLVNIARYSIAGFIQKSITMAPNQYMSLVPRYGYYTPRP